MDELKPWLVGGTWPPLGSMVASMLAAAKESNRGLYRNRYISGDVRIARKAPDSFSLGLTKIRSWDYAKHAGVSMRAARDHLRKLVRVGYLTEHKCSNVCSFRLRRQEAERIGREIIAALEAEGIPHEKGPAMLSDEELAAMQRLCVGHNWPIKFARAVERAVIERCAEVLAQISNDRSGPYWAGANRCIAAIRAMLEEKP